MPNKRFLTDTLLNLGGPGEHLFVYLFVLFIYSIIYLFIYLFIFCLYWILAKDTKDVLGDSDEVMYITYVCKICL